MVSIALGSHLREPQRRLKGGSHQGGTPSSSSSSSSSKLTQKPNPWVVFFLPPISVRKDTQSA